MIQLSSGAMPRCRQQLDSQPISLPSAVFGPRVPQLGVGLGGERRDKLSEPGPVEGAQSRDHRRRDRWRATGRTRASAFNWAGQHS